MSWVLPYSGSKTYYFLEKFISSAQCKSVVSAFWSFCRRSHFMLKIPLFFLVFWHLIFTLKLSLVWVGTWCKAWIVCFCMYFQYLHKTQFHPKCHLRPLALSQRFVFCWFLKCSLSHISFNSLVTCHSFCSPDQLPKSVTLPKWAMLCLIRQHEFLKLFRIQQP